MWHLSPVTYSTTSTLPSHGEEIVSVYNSGSWRLILRVKKEQKVGYSLKGNYTSFKFSLYNFAKAVNIGRRSNVGIFI